MFRARSVASIIALRVTAGCIARLDGGHDGRTDGRLVEGMCKVGAEAFSPGWPAARERAIGNGESMDETGLSGCG